MTEYEATVAQIGGLLLDICEKYKSAYSTMSFPRSNYLLQGIFFKNAAEKIISEMLTDGWVRVAKKGSN